jgi:hypothetical protein
MDEIQKVLIAAGRKNLAREYYKKATTAGQLQKAVDTAVKKFWESIAKSFPEIKTNNQDQLTPLGVRQLDRFDIECKKVVQQWLEDYAPVK